MRNSLITYSLILISFFLASCTESTEEPQSALLIDHWNRKANLPADELKNQALEYLENSEDDYLKALSHYMLGYFYGDSAQYDKELEHYQESMNHLNKSGMIDDKLLGHMFRNKGIIAKVYEHYEEAVRSYDSALFHYGRFPSEHTLDLLHTTYTKGTAMKHLDVSKASDVFSQLLEDAGKHNNSKFELKALRQLGELNILKENYPTAEAYLKEALSLYESSGVEDRYYHTRLLHSMSRVYLKSRNFSEQEKYLKMAIEVGKGYHYLAHQIDLAESLQLQGKKAEALDLLIAVEKNYVINQPFDTDHIKLYELLGQLSPNPSVFFDKERKERKKYEEIMNATIARDRQVQLGDIEKSVSHLVEKNQFKVISKEREILFIQLIFLVALVFSLIWVFLYYRKRYLDRKWFRETFKL